MDDLKEVKFILQDTLVNVKLAEDMTSLNVIGLTMNIKEGKEIEVPYWVAEEIVKAGKGELIEDRFNVKELAKAHWREALPSSRHLSPIGDNFYFNLRRFSEKLKDESVGNIEKMNDLEKVNSMAQDIINCRVRKLVSLATSQVDQSEIIKNLTFEEKMLFDTIKELVSNWKKKILEVNILGESSKKS